MSWIEMGNERKYINAVVVLQWTTIRYTLQDRWHLYLEKKEKNKSWGVFA